MAGTGSPGAACRLRAVGASGSLLLLLLLLLSQGQSGPDWRVVLFDFQTVSPSVGLNEVSVLSRNEMEIVPDAARSGPRGGL